MMKPFASLGWMVYKRMVYVLIAGLFVATLSTNLFAQPSDDFRAVYVNNGILRAGVGLDGQVNIGGTNYDAIGRFTIGTVQGARFSTDDDNTPLVFAYPYPCGNFGIVTVRIVNADGDVEDLTWGTDDGEWLYGVEPFTDRNARYIIVGRWLHADSGIRVDQGVELVGGYARITWTITNTGAEAQQVGLRFLLDQEVGDYVVVPGYFPVQTEMNFVGGQIPPYIDAVSRRTTTAPQFRWVLKQSGLTTPDRVVIAQFLRVSAQLWEFNTVPDFVITDHAFASYWNPVTIAPGRSRTIVTMVGLGTSSNNPEGRYALDTESPGVVGLDASTSSQLSPEEFLISASVTNYYSFNAPQNLTFDSVSFSISLPPGLALADGESITKTVTTVTPSETSTVSWRVKPTGARAGELTYRVYSAAQPGNLSKSVSRSLIVPMTAKINLQPGYQMVSLPFAFEDSAPESVLGIDRGQFTMLRWDTNMRRYAMVNNIRPGEGYWLRVHEAQTLTLSGARMAGDAFGGALRLPLLQGWVQIGNPYPYPVPIGLIRFVDTTRGITLSFAEAVQSGLVRGLLFYYDTVPSPGYKYISLLQDPSMHMMPGVGYWIFVQRSNLEIIFANVVAPGASISFPSRANIGGLRWQVLFTAHSENTMDASTIIGAASRAADGLDIYDMPKPPAPVEPSVRAVLLTPDGQSMLAQDIRADSNRRQTWDMMVSAPTPNASVVLRWSGLQNLPATMRLRLVDTEASVSRDMRSTSSYTFNVGASGSRLFQVVAEPRGVAGLRITALRVARTRGGAVSVSYTLSDNASARVRILSASGRVVQTLQAGETASRGVTNLTWNGRDSAGIAVPAGGYLVEVMATSEDGQTARAVQPIVITR